MELHGLKPSVVLELSRDALAQDGLSARSAQHVLLDPHVFAPTPARAVPMAAGGALPLLSATLRARSLPTPVQARVQPAAQSASPFPLLNYERLPRLNLEPLGTVKSNFARLEGIPPGVNVVVNGVMVSVTGPEGQVYVEPGRVVVFTRDGTLLALGQVEKGGRYQVLERALTRNLEQWNFEGPHGTFQFELVRLSQVPDKPYITVQRLKNSSWVHVAGQWYQADGDGTVQVGPLEPGVYAVLVADRSGVLYANFDAAAPGDTLQGAFNYAGGWGYYGWYSGKSVEVRRAFIDVVDEFGFGDSPSISKVRKIQVLDTFQSSESPLGRKGPGRQLDTFLWDDQLALTPVKMTVREVFTAADRAWKHLRPVAEDTFTVDAQGSVFNTRIRVYDFFTVQDRVNHPASWVVLDVFRVDDLPTHARTKQTVYEQFRFTDAGSSTLRHFRKGDGFLFQDLSQRVNASRFAQDVFTVMDSKVQSLLALLGEDRFAVTDSALARPASLRVWDSLLLVDLFGSVRNQRVRASDVLELVDRVLSAPPWRSRVLDTLLVRDHLSLTMLGPTQPPGDVYLPGPGTVPPGPVPPGADVIRSGVRAALDRFFLREEVVPELPRPDDEAPMLVERASLERYLRRPDELHVRERGILTRQLYAQDRFTMEEHAALPQPVSFAPSGLKLVKIGEYRFRPELRLAKGLSGVMHAAYLRDAGGLYLATSQQDGTWQGVTARLVTSTDPVHARSVAVAEHGGSVYTGYALVRGDFTELRVFKDGTPFWTRTVNMPDGDLQLASDERYAGSRGRLLVGYLESPTRLAVQDVTNGLLTRHDTVFRARLDQVAVAHGQVTWVMADLERPNVRSLFQTEGLVRVERRDRRTLRLTPTGGRVVAQTLRPAVGDTLSLHARPRKGAVEPVRAGLAGEDELTLTARPVRGRLIAAVATADTRDALMQGLTLRGARLVSSTLRPQVQDTRAVRVRALDSAAEPVAVPTQDGETLSPNITLIGGRYERK